MQHYWYHLLSLFLFAYLVALYDPSSIALLLLLCLLITLKKITYSFWDCQMLSQIYFSTVVCLKFLFVDKHCVLRHEIVLLPTVRIQRLLQLFWIIIWEINSFFYHKRFLFINKIFVFLLGLCHDCHRIIVCYGRCKHLLMCNFTIFIVFLWSRCIYPY